MLEWENCYEKEKVVELVNPTMQIYKFFYTYCILSHYLIKKYIFLT